MAFSFPSSALVPFPKLFALAHRNTKGLVRGVSQSSVDDITNDMNKVGLIVDKFGKPTINLSCDTTDENYREIFAPTQSDNVKILNLEENILDLEGFPTLQITPRCLKHIQFPDGRHRIMSCNNAFGESIYGTHVLCFITTFKDPSDMKLDSLKKSEARPFVHRSVHDAIECLDVPLERGLNLDSLRNKVKGSLGYTTQSHIDRFCKLLVHLFPSSKKLLDTRRDSSIFSEESIFGSSGTSFIVLMQESGRVQLSCYRYGLSRALRDLHCKEEIQGKIILFCDVLARRISRQRDRPKALAKISQRVHEVLKGKDRLNEEVKIQHLPSLFADAIRASRNDFPNDLDEEDFVEAIKSVFTGNENVLSYFSSPGNTETAICENDEVAKVDVSESAAVEIGIANLQEDENNLSTGPVTSQEAEHVGSSQLNVSATAAVETERTCLRNDEQHLSTTPGLSKVAETEKSSKSGEKSINSNSQLEHHATLDNSGFNSEDYRTVKAGIENLEVIKLDSDQESFLEPPIELPDKQQDPETERHVEGSEQHGEVKDHAERNQKQGIADFQEQKCPVQKDVAEKQDVIDLDAVDLNSVYSMENEAALDDAIAPSTESGSNQARRSSRIKAKLAISAQTDTQSSALKRPLDENLSSRPNIKKHKTSSGLKKTNKISQKKFVMVNVEERASISAKARCGIECLRYASEILSRLVFLRLEKAGGQAKFSRLERLQDQGSEAIVLIDDEFLDSGGIKQALRDIKDVVPDLCYVVSVSKKDAKDDNGIAPDSIVLCSGVFAFVSENAAGTKLFIKVHGHQSCGWKGPARFINEYKSTERASLPLNDFLRSFWSWIDVRMHKSTVVDLMLSFHDCLETPVNQGFKGFYFKCLTQRQEDSGLSTHYLQTLQRHVLRHCDCGGHALLSAENESYLNEYEGPLHDCSGPERQPFLLTTGQEDAHPFGKVFSHTSLLLRKDTGNEIPSFANDDNALCSIESNPESGFPLHRGAFVTRETAEQLAKENVPCDILLPKCYLVDSLSKMRHYENSLSPFEMRDLYVSGIIYRKLWLFFSNRSVASLFNEGNGGGEIDFTPRYLDFDYMKRLYEEGFGAVKEKKMSPICCTLKPAMIQKVPELLRCSKCGAVELLTDYGKEYVHD